MAKAWLTYAWTDNENEDVDFVVQELEHIGVEVKLDRRQIITGARVWEQLGKFISDPALCDAWIIYATQASITSKPCKEELYYALGRALDSRKGDFPLIGISPNPIPSDLLPPAISTRLYVSLKDTDWKERVLSGIEKRAPLVKRPEILPYYMKVHYPTNPGGEYFIEVRPRAGSWNPFIAMVPIEERDKIGFRLFRNAAGKIPMFGSLQGVMQGEQDGWAFTAVHQEATSTMSYFITCKQLPTKVVFGEMNGLQWITENPH